MAGASASWHDLVLYLVARHVGPTAAQALAKFMLLQWHTDGQGPYVPFDAPTGSRRRDRPRGAGMAVRGVRRRGTGDGAGRAFRIARADVQAALRAGHRVLADRLRPARPRRGGETAPRADIRVRRRDQLPGRLRGPGVISTAVQANHPGHSGGVPTQAPASCVRANRPARPRPSSIASPGRRLDARSGLTRAAGLCALRRARRRPRRRARPCSRPCRSARRG